MPPGVTDAATQEAEKNADAHKAQHHHDPKLAFDDCRLLQHYREAPTLSLTLSLCRCTYYRGKRDQKRPTIDAKETYYKRTGVSR